MRWLRRWGAGVGAAVVVLALLILDMGFYRPQMRRLMRVESDLASVRASLAQVLSAGAQSDSLRQILEAIRPGGSEGALGAEDPLELVNRLVRAERLRLLAVRPGEPEVNESFVQIPVRVEVEGSYAAVSGLMKRIDGPGTVATVREFQLTEESETPGTRRLNLGLLVLRPKDQGGAP